VSALRTEARLAVVGTEARLGVAGLRGEDDCLLGLVMIDDPGSSASTLAASAVDATGGDLGSSVRTTALWAFGAGTTFILLFGGDGVTAAALTLPGVEGDGILGFLVVAGFGSSRVAALAWSGDARDLGSTARTASSASGGAFFLLVGERGEKPCNMVLERVFAPAGVAWT
jgi:hypothetical protein